MIFLQKRKRRYRRHKRVRAKIRGKEMRTRLCVFKSVKHIYAQLVDDENGKTLVAASDLELKEKKKPPKISSRLQLSKTKDIKKEEVKKRTGKKAVAFEVGKLIAEKSLQKKIEKMVFDRGGYKYHGRVQALAEGLREGGLKF